MVEFVQHAHRIGHQRFENDQEDLTHSGHISDSTGSFEILDCHCSIFLCFITSHDTWSRKPQIELSSSHAMATVQTNTRLHIATVQLHKHAYAA